MFYVQIHTGTHVHTQAHIHSVSSWYHVSECTFSFLLLDLLGMNLLTTVLPTIDASCYTPIVSRQLLIYLSTKLTQPNYKCPD